MDISYKDHLSTLEHKRI